MPQRKEVHEEVAYRSIIRMILDNAFRPGDFLLETELAKKLDLSRTPVSHALGRLVAEGFLEKRPKKGCVIPQVSAEDARQVFTARQLIESELAALAAREATESDLERLTGILDEQRRMERNHCKESYALLNEQFHFAIAQASHNAYLERYCRHMFWRSNVYIFFFDSYYWRANEDPSVHLTPQQHVDVAEAIFNRDEHGARRRMRDHVRNTFDKLSKPWDR